MLKKEDTIKIRGVFVIGRQHSGNTFLTRILGSAPDFFMDENENSWFEFIPDIQQKKSISEQVEISTKHLLRGKPTVAQQQLENIQSWAAKHPDTDVYQLFRESMKIVTTAEHKRYWVLKATSYVFYAKEILEHCPEVKLIYIMRNPLDLTASTKKRNKNELDWLISTNLAWRKGVSIARELSQQFPKRFLIVKYEDLVQKKETFVEISNFLGVSLKDNYNDMPVVNTSDQPYATSTEKGLKKNRVFYFPNILSKGEIFFSLKLAGGKSFIQTTYPDIPISNNIKIFDKLSGIVTLIRMGGLFAKKHFNIFSIYQLNRFLRRVKLMLSK